MGRIIDYFKTRYPEIYDGFKEIVEAMNNGSASIATSDTKLTEPLPETGPVEKRWNDICREVDSPKPVGKGRDKNHSTKFATELQTGKVAVNESDGRNKGANESSSKVKTGQEREF